MMPHRERPLASRLTQRSVRGTGGLFDKGVPGEAGFSSAADINDEKPLIFLDNTATAAFSMLQQSPLGVADISSLPLVESGSIALEDAKLALLGDESPVEVTVVSGTEETDEAFFEAFTDLSAYLMGSDIGKFGLEDIQETSGVAAVVEPSIEGGPSLKRTALMAFESDSHPPPNTDHDDLFKKRPRVASTSSTQSAADESTTKDEKYRDRRRKNNVASRRSRETRKQKYVTMEHQAKELVISNARLREQVKEMEEITALMKESLVQKMVGGIKTEGQS